MNESNRTVVLISASPKADQNSAVSAFLAKRGEALFQEANLLVQTIPVKHALQHHETEPAYSAMQAADAIVFVFPLYFFCMPAMLTRFLQDFTARYPVSLKAANVYAIVNCGFPEPEINLEAMRVVESFSLQTGRSFQGGLLIGCGGMVFGAQQAPFMRPVFAQVDGLFSRVKDELLNATSAQPDVTQVTAAFPRFLYFFGGNSGWRATARKNGVRTKDLYRTPYRE